MKMALYVESGVTQFVLTGETPWEKKTLADLTRMLEPRNPVYPEAEPKRTVPAIIFGGEFYHCRGGWVREGSGHDSLIVRFDAATESE